MVAAPDAWSLCAAKESVDCIVLGQSGGRTFNFLVDEVLASLRRNREEHQAVLKEAQENYRKKVIEELDRALRDARNGTAFRTSIHLEMPRNHTREYSNAIEMMEATLRAGDLRIGLTADEYERFMKNRWHWIAQFAAVANSYTHQNKMAVPGDDESLDD